MGTHTSVPDGEIPQAVVEHFGLGTLLQRALAHAGDSRAAQFTGWARSVTAQNLRLFADGARIRDELERAGITPVLLKGGAFVVRCAPGDVGIRRMADLDLLVGPGRFPDAARRLESLGMERVPPVYRFSSRIAPAWTFVLPNATGGTQIDLHRHVAQWPVQTTFGRRVQAEREWVSGWQLPRRAHMLMLAAMHRARHGFALAGRDLLDIQRLGDDLDEPGWRDLAHDVGRERLIGACYAAVRQAAWWFDERGDAHPGVRALRAVIGDGRRRLMERMAPPEGALAPDEFWQRPIVRNLLVGPVALGSTWRSAVAAATFLPLRVMDALQFRRAQPRCSDGSRRSVLSLALFGDFRQTKRSGRR